MSGGRCCPAPLLHVLTVGLVFDCGSGGPWPFCVAEQYPVGDLGSAVTLPGLARSADPGITFFAHAHPITTAMTKDGDDLIISQH